jgi:hypothetical protein
VNKEAKPVTWVLERDVFPDAAFEAMCAYLRDRDLPLRTVTISAGQIDGRAPRLQGAVVCYGSIGMAEVAESQGWKPGVFSDPYCFNYEAYREALGELILNPDAERSPLSQVIEHVKSRGLDAFFIKPNDDAKAFAGTMMRADEFEAWVSRLRQIGYLDDQDFDVVVSAPRKIGREWRVVVVDGEIIEASLYKQSGQVMIERQREPAVEAMVREAHTRFKPAPVYVIDIAETDGSLKVVEYNTFNSASLYACDAGRVIEAVSAYVASLD